MQSETLAHSGKLTNARELTQQAADTARQAGTLEASANFIGAGAVREALVGNLAFARQQAQSASKLSTAREVRAISALALALAGDAAQARRLADDLSARFPENTIVQVNYLPTIRAAASLQADDAYAAIKTLEAVSPYELGSPYSSVVDMEYTKVIGYRTARIVAWYDNEWGFSNRICELSPFIMDNLRKREERPVGISDGDMMRKVSRR